MPEVALLFEKAVISAYAETPHRPGVRWPEVPTGFREAFAGYPRGQIQSGTEASEWSSTREAVWDIAHYRRASRPRAERTGAGGADCRVGHLCTRANDWRRWRAFRLADSRSGRN